jgi:hypothetical protein
MWNPGQSIALRGIVNERVWSALSVIVVQDLPGETVLLLTPDAQCAYPEGYFCWKYGDYSEGTRWQEARSRAWTLREFAWQTKRFLIFLEPQKYYAIFAIWHHETDQFSGYYVNFQLPYRRSHCGFDTLDLDLDMVIDPQLTWRWKDEEAYHEGIREGGIQETWVKGIEDSQPEILARIRNRSYPLDGSWLRWRPVPAWNPPRLPDRWVEL